MKTHCKDCGLPMEVASESAEPMQCECCETNACSCGSTKFRDEFGVGSVRKICTVCNCVVEDRMADAALAEALGVK